MVSAADPPPDATDPGGGAHPFFPDHPRVRWYRSVEAALARAAADGKRVFVHVSRPKCEGSRFLVEKTIAKEEIHDELERLFVSVAVDADDPAVAPLLARLPRREPTPLCVYLAADGRLLHSTAGGRPPAVLLNDFLEAAARR